MCPVIVAGNLQLARQCVGEQVEHRSGKDMQRRTGQVHRLIRHPLLVVVDNQRVGQLDTETMAAILGVLIEFLNERDRAFEMQVVLEGFRDESHVVVAEVTVHDSGHACRAKQRRVELDDHVKVVRVDQMLGDLLNFVRWASVERGQCDGVGDDRRELDVGKLGEHAARVCGNLGSQSFDLRARVAHRVDEARHLRRLDPREVVADRHVEHVRPRVAVGVPADVLTQRFPLPEDLDDHPGLGVLLDTLRHQQFLAPLDVVANGFHVDARTGDLEIIQHLHRLQFKKARPTEPRQHDVLGHLTMWSCSGTER